ncbi:MAG: arginyltransferase [Gammaproteobacteria bacterium]
MKTLNFYLTTEQPCSYLPGRRASSVIVDPRAPITTQMYSALIDYGFRRNAEHVYRPHCQSCASCISVRIPASEFMPSRSQKRTWRRNEDIEVREVAMAYQEEHFELYHRYLSGRHSGGGMDNMNPEQYMDFIMLSGLDNTRLYEFRLDDKLLAVAVVDHLPQGLSAVYTFFDPQHEARSLGTHAILWQIHEARRLGLTWVYLGYWIRECRKMSYKNRFRPAEIYRNNQWLRIDA